ncbi:hypothetical protein BDW59DRAFT_148468 [Aspergillus cavernicola]|uniref:Uncharacterized protein n=1 Tax=Aspergillus cavernicola TaxID=176166 RepID=A0ABR4I7E5_9EURO
MHPFNPINSFDSLFSISRRQSDPDSTSNSVCWGGLGAAECLPGSSCHGVVYENQCQENAGDECCLNRGCNTSRGGGFCKNRDNQTCEGDYVVGTGPDYPCPGPSYILCCVGWEDMLNQTQTQTQTQTTLTTSTSPTTGTTEQAPENETETETAGPSESGDSGAGGLSASQKGGIAGGIVGAVAVTSIIFLVVFFLRRLRQQQQQLQQDHDRDHDRDRDRTEGTGGDGTGTGTGTDVRNGVKEEGEEGENRGVAMLASREKLELDATGRALHEMETTGTEREKGLTGAEVRTRMAELPGSMAIAEMPVAETEEAEIEHDSGDGTRRG